MSNSKLQVSADDSIEYRQMISGKIFRFIIFDCLLVYVFFYLVYDVCVSEFV